MAAGAAQGTQSQVAKTDGHLWACNRGDSASSPNKRNNVAAVPTSVSAAPNNASAIDDAITRAEASAREQEQDAAGNFKRLRDGDPELSYVIPGNVVEAELEARLAQAHSNKATNMEAT